jgi:hypothetical protein
MSITDATAAIAFMDITDTRVMTILDIKDMTFRVITDVTVIMNSSYL